MIKKCDFVMATRTTPDVVARSVGLVDSIDGEYLIVFFIGIKKSLKIHSSDVEYLDVEKTGKPKYGTPYLKKICNMCHLLKDSREFDYNQNDKKGRKTSRPSCSDCRKNIDGMSMTQKAAKYFEETRPKKGTLFTCPLCQKTTIAFITANPVRDHDHDTGNARAWICDSCNTGLGRFKDNPKFIERLITYLESFRP